MSNPSLHDRCRQAVDVLATEHNCPLRAEGLDALAAAIAPFVEQTPAADADAIRRIALNYYLDGPMVQQMLTADSVDGEQLWAEWRSYMVSLARSKGLSPAQADDLAQDAYLETVKALRTFRFGSRLKTYFCGVFINCYRHWMRATQRVEQREQVLAATAEEDADQPLPELVDEQESPEEAVIEHVYHSQIGALVAREIQQIVNSEDFQILYWYYVEKTFIEAETGKRQKWTDKAIGVRLKMPLNTVTSRRRRALQRLQQNSTLAAVFAQFAE